MRPFTESELVALDAALIVAADVYDEDAHKMMEAGQKRTADQFKLQARKARELAEDIARRNYDGHPFNVHYHDECGSECPAVRAK